MRFPLLTVTDRQVLLLGALWRGGDGGRLSEAREDAGQDMDYASESILTVVRSVMLYGTSVLQKKNTEYQVQYLLY